MHCNQDSGHHQGIQLRWNSTNIPLVPHGKQNIRLLVSSHIDLYNLRLYIHHHHRRCNHRYNDHHVQTGKALENKKYNVGNEHTYNFNFILFVSEILGRIWLHTRTRTFTFAASAHRRITVMGFPKFSFVCIHVTP